MFGVYEDGLFNERASRRLKAKMRSISVFCGSRTGQSRHHLELARETGRVFAKNNIRLVYGGAINGLMGEMARAALDADGEVLGIIPEYLIPSEGAQDGIKLRITATLAARKAMMINEASGFLVLPGGAGTLEEVFDMIVLAQLGQHSKPAAFVDASYWAELKTLLQKIVANGFADSQTPDRLSFHDHPQSALDAVLKTID
jgi:uncharacterized protein (TIGR00730 family)